MADSVRGQTALITGAAKRIGREIALALADEGAHIVVHYRHSSDEAEELCRELDDRGVRGWTVRADFAKPEQIETLIERSLEAAGSLDILVNNASIFPEARLETETLDDFLANMQVNAWAPFALSRAFAQQVGRGKIINLHDARLDGYDWAHVGYIWSKLVLAAITRMTALEYAPDITVNAVAAGLILPPAGQDERFLDRLAVAVPLKRHGDLRDIADAVLFLVKSDFITGEVIHVDGGRHLKEGGGGPHPH